MKGQKNLHCLLAGILLSISSGSFAQPAVVVSPPEVTVPELVASTPTMAELLQQPVYKARWQQMVKGQKNLPAWARKGAGTSGPYENITCGAHSNIKWGVSVSLTIAVITLCGWRLATIKNTCGACVLPWLTSPRRWITRVNLRLISGWVAPMRISRPC